MINFTSKKKADDTKVKTRPNCKLIDSDEEGSLDVKDFESTQLWKKPIKRNDGKVTKGAAIKAIYIANGVPAVAARALGITRATYMNWVKKDKDIEAAYKDARSCTADFAENKLIECIEKRIDWAINLALKYRSDYNEEALLAKEKGNNKGSILEGIENMLDEGE